MSDDDISEKEMQDERARVFLCAAIGANEQARATPVFGEKVWWRLCAQHYAEQSKQFGGNFKFTDETVVLEAPFGNRFIKFYEKDLPELRKIVAEWDGKPESQYERLIAERNEYEAALQELASKNGEAFAWSYSIATAALEHGKKLK